MAAGIHDRQSRLREELPPRQHEDDDRRRHHEDIRVDEPAEITNRQEDRPEALVEIAAGNDIHADDAFGGPLGGDDVALAVAHHRDRAEENSAIVEQPVGPAELEEGIAEKRCQPADLHLENGMAAMEDEGQVGEDGVDFLRRAEQSKAAADREDRGRSEEGGAVLQAGHDLRVDHLQVAAQRIIDPLPPPLGHRMGEAGAPEEGTATQQPGIAHPDPGKEGQSDIVRRRHQ